MFEIGLFFQSTVGLACSFLVITLLRPRLPAPWLWAWQGIAQHAGLWFFLYAVLVMILGRPWFATAVGMAFLMLLVQVSNAKFHSLREAFVFQDFEYFTDAIRHPRLYIPFLGWRKFALIAFAVLAALGIGLWLEASPAGRFSLHGQLGSSIALLVLGGALVFFSKGGPAMVFVPDTDMRLIGFLASLWRYAWAERLPLKLHNQLPNTALLSAERPDFLVVQSESFFDPRQLFSGVRADVLMEFDRINTEALSHGRLAVPAWGANTVRSEFAFLCGATEAQLGVHRFNPYRQILNAEVVSLASVLKAAGYQTICVHPYPASFYGRDKVYPHLGFDEFIDIRSFDQSERSGPYVSDHSITDKVKGLLGSAAGPLFIFVITMENHGPLHLEKPEVADYASLFCTNPPAGCDDLTIYLRHVKNADQMIGDLREFLVQYHRPARLCWYGDHVPIMAEVYGQLGDPDGMTEYFIWSNRLGEKKAPKTVLSLDALAGRLLTT